MCETLDDSQLAERLQVSARWVATHARQEDDPLPAFHVGRKRRFFWNCDSKLGRALLDWIDRHTNQK